MSPDAGVERFEPEKGIRLPLRRVVDQGGDPGNTSCVVVAVKWAQRQLTRRCSSTSARPEKISILDDGDYAAGPGEDHRRLVGVTKRT